MLLWDCRCWSERWKRLLEEALCSLTETALTSLNGKIVSGANECCQRTHVKCSDFMPSLSPLNLSLDSVKPIPALRKLTKYLAQLPLVHINVTSQQDRFKTRTICYVVLQFSKSQLQRYQTLRTRINPCRFPAANMSQSALAFG